MTYPLTRVFPITYLSLVCAPAFPVFAISLIRYLQSYLCHSRFLLHCPASTPSASYTSLFSSYPLHITAQFHHIHTYPQSQSLLKNGTAFVYCSCRDTRAPGHHTLQV